MPTVRPDDLHQVDFAAVHDKSKNPLLVPVSRSHSSMLVSSSSQIQSISIPQFKVCFLSRTKASFDLQLMRLLSESVFSEGKSVVNNGEIVCVVAHWAVTFTSKVQTKFSSFIVRLKRLMEKSSL